MNVICPRVPDCDRPLSCLASSRPFSFELIGLGVMTYPTRESDCRRTLLTFDDADLLWIRYFMERSRADGLLSRNPTTEMSSAATTDVKTAVPIFDGSNYNVWVDQMKFWLQSQNLWRIVNGTIPRPTVSPGPPPSHCPRCGGLGRQG